MKTQMKKVSCDGPSEQVFRRRVRSRCGLVTRQCSAKIEGVTGAAFGARCFSGYVCRVAQQV
jgi:hypothetical protein